MYMHAYYIYGASEKSQILQTGGNTRVTATY